MVTRKRGMTEGVMTVLEMIGAVVMLVAGLLGVGKYAQVKHKKAKRLEEQIEALGEARELDRKIADDLDDPVLRDRMRDAYQRDRADDET